jgi:hypothetical protein
VIRELGPGGGDELVQALKIARRLEQMLGFDLIHGFPSMPDFSPHLAPPRAAVQEVDAVAGLCP